MFDDTPHPTPPAFAFPPHPTRFRGVLEFPWWDALNGAWRYFPVRFVMTRRPRLTVTISIIAFTFFVYVATTVWAKNPLFGINGLVFDWAIIRYYVIDLGQVWRLATAQFLHADFGHWFENAIFLYLIGRVIEPTFGSWRTLALFMLSGIAATSLTSTEVVGMVAGLGMSGSLYGLIGAQIGHLHNNRAVIIDYDRRIRRNYALIGILILLNGVTWLSSAEMISRYGIYVDVLAHLGGLVAGYVLTRLAGPLLRFTVPEAPQDFAFRVIVSDTRPFTLRTFSRIALITGGFAAVVLALERLS